LKVGETILIISGDVAAPIPHPEPKIEAKAETIVKPASKAIQEVKATPAVRKLAKDLNVDLASIKGSGPDGRILEADIRSVTQHPVSEKEHRVPLKGLRRVIADRMIQSKTKIPDVTLVEEMDVTELKKTREMLKVKAEKRGVRLTLLAFIMRATSLALKDHPIFNSSFDEVKSEIIMKQDVHLGIAIDTSDGLIVVKVQNAEVKSVLDLAEEVEKLSSKARQSSLQLSEVQGSTFTITNIGAIGGSVGIPIINYPETAILGVYRATSKPAVRDGQITVRDIMNISVTFDHRVTDGAEAGRFLNKIKELIEKPALLLID
jgi:pyruvate dehydrogenase E2 component (dihydrolipoamide acetyltransferase)